MPKRTNNFQSFIALARRSLVLIESEIRVNRLTGELRKLDVFVHTTVTGNGEGIRPVIRSHEGRSLQSANTDLSSFMDIEMFKVYGRSASMTGEQRLRKEGG